jgi:hypothetical protein
MNHHYLHYICTPFVHHSAHHSRARVNTFRHTYYPIITHHTILYYLRFIRALLFILFYLSFLIQRKKT